MVPRHLLLCTGARPRPFCWSGWRNPRRGMLPNMVMDASIFAITHGKARYIAATGSGEVVLVSRGDPLSHPERWKLD